MTKVRYMREVDARRLVELLQRAVSGLRADDGLLCGEMTEIAYTDGIEFVRDAIMGIRLEDGPVEIVVMADPWPYIRGDGSWVGADEGKRVA